MHIRLNLLHNLVRSQSETLPAHLLEDPSAWEGDRYVMYCSASGSSGCSSEGLVPRPPPAPSADPTTPAMSPSPSAGGPIPLAEPLWGCPSWGPPPPCSWPVGAGSGRAHVAVGVRACSPCCPAAAQPLRAPPGIIAWRSHAQGLI